ncbi:hypothetical protein HZS_8145 [Henneguya salminicola]|nr:hypothetical protein HZS_8145 [Henneguya salminicola]
MINEINDGTIIQLYNVEIKDINDAIPIFYVSDQSTILHSINDKCTQKLRDFKNSDSFSLEFIRSKFRYNLVG